ncbi:unnamed protein product [Ceratitis capitata]|nr:unnamed protein product [Ceratitis capitata]
MKILKLNSELIPSMESGTPVPQGIKTKVFSKSKQGALNSHKVDNLADSLIQSSPNSNILTEVFRTQSPSANSITQDKSQVLKTQINNQSDNFQHKNNLLTGTLVTREDRKMSTTPTKTVNPPAAKSREEIMAEREAKKLAKQLKKAKVLGTELTAATPAASNINTSVAQVDSIAIPETSANTPSNTTLADGNALAVDKSREQIKAEREAKKKAKQAQKEAKATGLPEVTAKLEAIQFVENGLTTPAQDEKKKPALSKSERRAIQEAQRAAKAQALAQKTATPKAKPVSANNQKSSKPTPDTPAKTASKTGSLSTTKSVSPTAKSLRINDCKVRLFNHLEKTHQEVSLFLNNPHLHPSVARLGEQYAQRTVVGSNARCIAFLNALKMVIRDFETPLKKEFARSLETTITDSVEHLQKCRPLAVSVSNAYKHIKHVLTQLPTDQPESDLKENLCRFIDTYIENQIGKAAEAISYSVQEKISNGDVILTFGCSSLITYIFEEAQRRNVDFRVIVVDSRPFCEGRELLRRLTVKGIPCSYVLINAISFVMPEATKILLGAHALLANGYVMARTGTAQVALVARSFNVPVLVCCETHKFSERSQTDAIVYNELGNPDDLIRSDKCSLANWQTKGKMSPLNLIYDITPPELVTAVVTEVSILPCTSVPVILRIKPTEIGY